MKITTIEITMTVAEEDIKLSMHYSTVTQHITVEGKPFPIEFKRFSELVDSAKVIGRELTAIK